MAHFLAFILLGNNISVIQFIFATINIVFFVCLVHIIAKHVKHIVNEAVYVRDVTDALFP